MLAKVSLRPRLDFIVNETRLIISVGTDLDKRNVHSPKGLTEWLGVSLAPAPNDAGVPTVFVQRKDPKCRFM